MTLPYIVNVALILGACLAFYKILLHRETFYRINRYVLLACFAIAFTLPLFRVPQQFSFRKTEKQVAAPIKYENTSTGTDREADTHNSKTVQPTPANPNTNHPINNNPSFSGGQLMNWLFWLYWFGVAIFAGSFLFQITVLFWRAYRNPVIIDGPYRIVEVSGDKAPCSFGNNIFINPEKYEWDTYNQILEHEKVHIRQHHTLDIIIAELVLIVQWFNPFAWIYRREVENNLEFLTDDQLIEQKIDKRSYQLSLVKVSAPHFPLKLTTNYNQSILKKRIAMMNAKRSNLHTAWKYFFLLPLLAFLACLLNEPLAHSQEKSIAKTEKKSDRDGISTEGYWFAVIKGDKVHIRFSDDKMEDENFSNSGNGATFNLNDLGTLPKTNEGNFAIVREAGKMEMKGKFDGNTGMGTYRFISDKSYTDYMNAELKEKLTPDEELAFFFINVRKDYLQMLKKEGFTDLDKNELMPLAALKVDAAYIKSMKESGLKDLVPDKLVALKAMNIASEYIREIREAGYKDITPDQLLAFKSQKIDKAYIDQVRKGQKLNYNDPEDLVSFKAMDIDEAFINSFKAIGYDELTHEELVSLKATGTTADYIKQWHDRGYKDIRPEEFIGMKTQNVTPDYMKSFEDMGYTNVQPEQLVAFKALNITPEYVKSFEAVGLKKLDMDQLPAFKSLNITPEYIKGFEAIGYKNIDADELPGLKSQNVTPDFIKSFEALGFSKTSLDEFIAIKTMGITADYIKDMRAKGFKYDKLEKYITLKSLD